MIKENVTRDWLTQDHGTPCVSILFDKDPAAQDTPEKRLAVRNALDDAEQKLAALGVRPADARQHLDDARQLQDEHDIWRDGAAGVAVYIAGADTRVVSLRDTVTPMRMVAPEHLYAMPILSRSANRRAFALCLSQHAARLVPMTGGHAEEEVELSASPIDLREGFEDLKRFIDTEKHVTVHTTSAPRQPGGGGQDAAFHGHGAASDDAAVVRWLKDYCHLVDDALDRVLQDDSPPIVLVAAEPLHSMFAHTTKRDCVLAPEPLGNADHLADHGVRELAEPHLDAIEDGSRLAHIYESARGAKLACDDPEDVLVASVDGRVAWLIVREGACLWGRYDAENRTVVRSDEPRPECEDLLNLAAIMTHRNSGAVHMVDPAEAPMPGDVTAVLRY